MKIRDDGGSEYQNKVVVEDMVRSDQSIDNFIGGKTWCFGLNKKTDEILDNQKGKAMD